VTTATVSQRIVAFLIDLVPIVFVASVMGILWRTSSLPAVWMIPPPVVGAAYFLLRDVTGASPGKAALGLRVVAKDGGESSVGQRVLRNVVFVLGPVVAIVPGLKTWMIVTVPVSSLVLLDFVFLLIQGERFSDKMAGTKVVRVSSHRAA
jgi:uncharacterized RDD family membrane protein YckC